MPGEGCPGPAGAAFVTGRCLYHINTFATGDTALARQLLDENYIQHNLAYGTGEDAFVASVEGLAGAPTSYYDLWRVENGKIAEHWDMMETIADESTWQNPNGKF